MRLSLETTSHAEAVRKVLDYQAKPHLADAGRWEFEVDQYLRDQQERGQLSASYAESRPYVLMRFAKEMDIDNPREATGVILQRWYDELKRQHPETAKHYIVHVRVFLSHLADHHKLHENPAKKVRFDKTVHRTRDVFIPRSEVGTIDR